MHQSLSGLQILSLQQATHFLYQTSKQHRHSEVHHLSCFAMIAITATDCFSSDRYIIVGYTVTNAIPLTIVGNFIIDWRQNMLVTTTKQVFSFLHLQSLHN